MPFCVRRCLYCDFYILPLGDGPPSKRLRDFRSLKHRGYLAALDRELAALPRDFRPRTVYVGGGTPTELPPDDLRRLFASLKKHIDFSDVVEFSCEANPGTLDPEMAQLLAAAGIDRVSLGVQSFDDVQLESLGRIHNAADACRGVRDLRAAGLRNISVDLLFALPGAGPGVIDTNLAVLAELQPEHVSWYSLEFEPGTPFTEMRDKGFLRENDDEESAGEYAHIRAGLQTLGFEQYELFSFSKPGFACRHNLNYWLGGEYHGCGPSAHSHVCGKRWSNLPDLAAYLVDPLSAHSPSETLAPEPKARERLITSLRLTGGIDEEAFAAESGFHPADLLGEALPRWIRAGWMERENDCLRLRPEAYLVSDALFRDML